MTSGSKLGHISRWLVTTFVFLAACQVATCPVRGQAAGEEHPLPSVEGNRAFSTERIISLLEKAGWREGLREQSLGALQSAFFSEGYLFAVLRLETRGSGEILHIDEDAPARFGDVRIYGAKNYDSAELRHSLGIDPGARFHPRRFDERVETLLKRYDEQGFPFVQVWLDSLEMHPDKRTVDVVMFVIEGEEKRLSRIRVQGLTKTREDVVVKLSGLKPGEPYSGRDLEAAYFRIRSSDLFEEVSYPEIQLAPGKGQVDVLIAVEEPHRRNSVSAALGYAQAEAGGKEVLSGTVRLNLRNMGGTLRDLGVFWENDGAGRSDTRLSYRDRFVFGRRFGLGLSIQQVGLDTLYTWQSLGLEVESPSRKLGRNLLSLKGALFADRNVFSEGDLLRSWRLRVAGGLSCFRGMPGGGGMLQLDGRLTWAQKKSYTRTESSGQRVSQVIVELVERFEIDLARAIFLRNETAYRGLESGEPSIPLSEQFYIGGARTLRGFRENQFHGRRVGYSRWEFVIGRRGENGYVFGDGGYVLRETRMASGEIERSDLFRFGYGFGLRTASKLGHVDISFGIGEKLSLRQTKVHVMLEETF